MLEHIWVDGFKSLSNFNLAIRPGLNILVGPNGAGKTNIISFFEFLSLLSISNLNEAVLQSGGTGAVFARHQGADSQKSLEFKISGTAFSGFRRQTALADRQIHYEYTAKVRFDAEEGRLHYLTQRVCAAIASPSDTFRKHKKSGRHLWDLDIQTTLEAQDNRSVVVRKLSRGRVPPRFYYQIPGVRGRRDFLLASVTNRLKHSEPDINCLLTLVASNFNNLRRLEAELSYGHAFNIVPSIVKRAEDIAMAPGINPDGSGLGATLMYLNRKRRTAATRPIRPSVTFGAPIGQRIKSSASFEEIVKLTRLANRSISNLRVETDSFDGRIRVVCEILSSEDTIDVPLQNISDGTAKWMTLIAALISNPSLFAVEEPENYLHPSMQREIVSIIRESASSQYRRSFALISTHSETLLNAARPEEIVVVYMAEGKTFAKKVLDANELNTQMLETGFGLGWYYTSGSLE